MDQIGHIKYTSTTAIWSSICCLMWFFHSFFLILYSHWIIPKYNDDFHSLSQVRYPSEGWDLFLLQVVFYLKNISNDLTTQPSTCLKIWYGKDCFGCYWSQVQYQIRNCYEISIIFLQLLGNIILWSFEVMQQLLDVLFWLKVGGF